VRRSGAFRFSGRPAPRGKRAPREPRSLYLLAEAYLKQNRVHDALEVIDRLDRQSGGDFRTLLGEGVLLAEFRLYPAAIRHFEDAVRANPASDEARYNLANAQFGRPKRSSPCSKPRLRRKKDDSYLALLGDIYARIGRSRDAIRVLGQAIENSPDNDQYYFSLALAELRADNPARAYTTLEQGLTRVPDSGMLYWGLGVVSILNGDASRGESYLKKAIELAPSRKYFHGFRDFLLRGGQDSKRVRFSSAIARSSRMVRLTQIEFDKPSMPHRFQEIPGKLSAFLPMPAGSSINWP